MYQINLTFLCFVFTIYYFNILYYKLIICVFSFWPKRITVSITYVFKLIWIYKDSASYRIVAKLFTSNKVCMFESFHIYSFCIRITLSLC
uniref:Uncharacterized protein n=1 Tax=virus sp. ctBM815 TaxID=2825806 RepID=A0A8S5RKR0_9VIRU|nr:MAG TPA: hypothetical protein [virus sp. ctBM815]DAV23949.1 MAG TPA: hypothetical protein [Bacteriophage sp.]